MATPPPPKKSRPSPVIEVHVPGQKWGNAKKKVLFGNGVRISPRTSRRNALSQLVREHMATLKLARTFTDVDFSLIRMVNIADHESRHDGIVNTNAFTDLKEMLTQHKDEFDEIIIWYTDTIRIGAKCEHVTKLKSEISDISENISVLCLKDSGRDLERVAKSVEKYLKQKTSIGSDIASHCNAGSNLTRHPDFEELAGEIQKKKREIIAQTDAVGKLDSAILNAAGRGKRIEKIPEELEKVYGDSVKKIQKDPSPENVERVARMWIRAVKTYQLYHGGNEGGDKEVNCVIYLRTTPTEHELSEFDDELGGRVYFDDIPRNQASGNLAAMLCIGEDRGIDFSAAALLNDKRKKRTTIKRPGIMKLMTTLCSHGIKFLFMETMNRAGSRRAQNLLLMKVCQLVEAEIILAKNVGQAKEQPGDGTEPSWLVTANDVVDMDVTRMEALEEAFNICKEEIGAVPVTFSDCDIFKKMSDADKEKLSKVLANIATRRFKKEKYQAIAEEIKQWLHNEVEDDIFGESSDEEDDDEDEEDESSGEEDDDESSEEEDEL